MVLAGAGLVLFVHDCQAALIDDRFGIAPMDSRIAMLLARIAGRQENSRSWGVLE